MNLFQGTLACESGRMVFTSSHLRLEGSVPSWQPIVPSLPRSCCLGVRPEHVQLVASGGTPATIEAVEHYGDRMDVVIRSCGHRIVARTGPDATLRDGGAVAVQFDLARAHLFESTKPFARLIG